MVFISKSSHSFVASMASTAETWRECEESMCQPCMAQLCSTSVSKRNKINRTFYQNITG